MAVSTASKLTAQFYEWERRGRGHVVAGYPAELEPPFVPFFGHYLDAPYVDDGRRHTLFSRLKGHFVPEHTVDIPETPTREVAAFKDEEESPSLTIYAVTLPKGYASKAESVEHCLTMLAMCKQATAFEIVADAKDVTVQVVCRDGSASFAYTQLKAYFPELFIQETYGDNVLDCAEATQAVYVVDFGLREEFMRPIAQYGGGSLDPFASLFGTLDQLRDGETLIFQVLFCGTQNAWSESVMKSVTDDAGKSFFMDAPDMPSLAKEKVSCPLFGATARLAAFADYADDAILLLQHAALALINATTSTVNALMPLSTPEYAIQERLSDLVLRQTHRIGMLLNTKELATLVHFPNAQLSRKLLRSNGATKRAPAMLCNNHPYLLGLNEHQGQVAEVGIGVDQRLRHLHVLGATGTGKSTLLHALIGQDMQQGVGCCVLDPHGDLIDAVLRSVPKERVRDVIVIDPSDGEYPVGLNILSAHSDLERELLASDLVALFRRFSTSWGDQLHSVLANAIMAFLYNAKPGHLGSLRKFLIEPQFRATVLSTCTDDELTYYWQKEYPMLKTSSIGSILTRLDSFLRPKAVRNMVCQDKGLDFPALMDGNKIVLVKLSQGLIGTENSYLLGACIVSKLQQAAMARQQQAAATRKPFFCYIDEFHHFVTPSMGEILSGARKYGLGLVLAHQDMQQVQRSDADIVSSLMSNVGTRLCFRLGDTDAKRMQDGFSAFGADDLQNLATGEAIARVNTADADFNLSVVPYKGEGADYTKAILIHSRSAYCVSAQPISPQVQEPPTEDANNVVEKEARPKSDPVSPPKRPAEPEAKREQPSRNAQEHRYVQAFVKSMAEQHGYRAHVEMPTPDGTGQIDVALERGNERVAVEISVSTSAEWELHNIRKCVNANYTKIVVCANNQRKLQHIKKKIEETLSPAEQSLIRLITTDEIPTLFSASVAANAAVTTMKGYRVKVKYDESPKDASAENIIRRIIKGGVG